MDLLSDIPRSPARLVCSWLCCQGFFWAFKLAISPLLKLLDSGLYFADIYSDVAYTRLLYENCHYKYFATSIGTLALSYLTTVFYLTIVFNQRETWIRAALYPFYTVIIVMRKILASFRGTILKLSFYQLSLLITLTIYHF